MTDAVASEDVLADGGTIVAATHRLARQLRWRHDRRLAATGARAWPTADVLPLDGWLRRTWELNLVRNAAVGEQRLLSEDESHLVWQRIIAGDADGDSLDAGVLVPLVASGWRLCQTWGISAASLVAAADSEDSRIFARWVRRYIAELKREGWIDHAGFLEIVATATSGACRTNERRVAFAGFDPWTPAMQRLAAGLEGRAVSTGRVSENRTHGLIEARAMRNPADELAIAFAWAAGEVARVAGSGAPPVAIVVPDLEPAAGMARRIGMDLLAPGWQLREPTVRPVALAAGRSLADYPIVAAALGLLEMLGSDLGFEQASRLLRSVYVTGADSERGARARAELRLRRMPLERITRRHLLDVLVREGATLAAGLWRTAGDLADASRPRRLAPGQWAARFASWLATAGWPGDRGLDSEEFQAAGAWQQLLESFAATDEVAGSLTLHEALGTLGRMARRRPFEPEAAEGAVQVLSVREAEGQEFSALWIAGMTADQWPPAARPHPLVPLSLQQSAGMPEAGATTMAVATQRRFDGLLSAAERVVVSYPLERDQAEALPSPLLAQWLPLAAPAAEFPCHPDRQQVAMSARLELEPDDPPPRLGTGGPRRGGSRVLTIQAVCPARAFVEFRLGAREIEPAARPLDAANRGRIIHDLLDALYREFPGGLAGSDAATLRVAYDAAFARIIERHLPGIDGFVTGLRRLEQARLWNLVQSLQALDADRPPFRALTEVARDVSIGPLSLAIRPDRVDELADGGELVLDYKTGRVTPGSWKKPRLQDSQLPLYAVATGCRGFAAVEVRVPAAVFRGVGEDPIVSGVRPAAEFFKEPGLDWQQALRRWTRQLEALATEFVDGDFRVNPADRKWATGQFAVVTRINTLRSAIADETGNGNGADEETVE